MTLFAFVKLMGTSLFAIAAFAYYVAHIGEKGASGASKSRLGQKLCSVQLTPGTRAAFAHFLFAVDRFFGKSLFSWRALSRSVLLSLAWVVLILGVCVAIFPNYRSWLAGSPMLPIVLKSAAWLLLASMLIDYLSICVTRALIRWSLTRGKVVVLGVAVADIVISATLFYLLFTVAKYWATPGRSFATPVESLSLWSDLSGLPLQLQTLNNLTSDMVRRLPDGSIAFIGGLDTEIVYAFPEGILFFSSLLTSVWMWLYVTAYWTVVSTVRIDRVKSAVLPHLNTEREPFFAIAYAIFGVALLASVAATLLFAIWQ